MTENVSPSAQQRKVSGQKAKEREKSPDMESSNGEKRLEKARQLEEKLNENIQTNRASVISEDASAENVPPEHEEESGEKKKQSYKIGDHTHLDKEKGKNTSNYEDFNDRKKEKIAYQYRQLSKKSNHDEKTDPADYKDPDEKRLEKARQLEEKLNENIQINRASVISEDAPAEKDVPMENVPVEHEKDNSAKKAYEYDLMYKKLDEKYIAAVEDVLSKKLESGEEITKDELQKIAQDTAKSFNVEDISEMTDIDTEVFEDVIKDFKTAHSKMSFAEKQAFKKFNSDMKAQQQESFNKKRSDFMRTAEVITDIGKGDIGKLAGDAVKDTLLTENQQAALGKANQIGSAVKNSDSVGGAVMDVGTTLAMIEAKKTVGKILDGKNDDAILERAKNLAKNNGNRYGIDKYSEVIKSSAKSKRERQEERRLLREESNPKLRNTKLKTGNSNKMQEEKKEYVKKQKAKDIKNKRKDMFAKEERKSGNTIFGGVKSTIKRFVKKKGSALIIGAGGTVFTTVFGVFLVIIAVSAFFGWLNPFSYFLAGEEYDPETGTSPEHEAATDAEIIDGYTLMVKNYLDVTQAYYYLNYGDWYGGTYVYPSCSIDYQTFLSNYCQEKITQIQNQYMALINTATDPNVIIALYNAMGQAINAAVADAQTQALAEYQQLVSNLDDELSATENRQHYEVTRSAGSNSISDNAEFDGKPIVGTNNFGNLEINSDLSAEELLAYIALYKSLTIINPDETEGDENTGTELNITAKDIMDFFEKTEYISITTEITHNNSCAGMNCKRRIVQDDSGQHWEYYCDSDHDCLSGEIGDCLTADELLDKIIELTDAEDNGIDAEQGKKMIEEYIKTFKKELGVDESEFRKFGAADNSTATEYYEKLIDDALPGNDIWEVNTPFENDEEENS